MSEQGGPLGFVVIAVNPVTCKKEYALELLNFFPNGKSGVKFADLPWVYGNLTVIPLKRLCEISRIDNGAEARDEDTWVDNVFYKSDSLDSCGIDWSFLSRPTKHADPFYFEDFISPKNDEYVDMSEGASAPSDVLEPSPEDKLFDDLVQSFEGLKTSLSKLLDDLSKAISPTK